ncbi:MAG: CAP domain-containing protein [Clostridia bacterium]
MKFKKIILFILIFLAIVFTSNKSTAMSHYQTVGTTTGLVTASALNVRQGPGTNYNIATVVYKNEYVRVFARIGNWYVIQTDKDFVGMASTDYIKLIYPQSSNSGSGSSSGSTTTTTSELTADEQEVFDLINAQRTAAGLSALKIDEELQNVARVKAKDMVDNNYFAHNSPTYGTPFSMIKNFGITYKAAGENIAGNSTNKGAVNAWMNSAGHKANILSNNYNYTGVAVVSSPKYGKIYVQMFIGK